MWEECGLFTGHGCTSRHVRVTQPSPKVEGSCSQIKVTLPRLRTLMRPVRHAGWKATGAPGAFEASRQRDAGPSAGTPCGRTRGESWGLLHRGGRSSPGPDRGPNRGLNLDPLRPRRSSSDGENVLALRRAWVYGLRQRGAQRSALSPSSRRRSRTTHVESSLHGTVNGEVAPACRGLWAIQSHWKQVFIPVTPATGLQCG